VYTRNTRTFTRIFSARNVYRTVVIAKLQILSEDDRNTRVMEHIVQRSQKFICWKKYDLSYQATRIFAGRFK
jgi:hypothetical protein